MTDSVCDGCGLPDPTETLWLDAPLGRTAVHVHRNRDCANLARERRGGGTFLRRTPGSWQQEDYERGLAVARRASNARTARDNDALYDRIRASLQRTHNRQTHQ